MGNTKNKRVLRESLKQKNTTNLEENEDSKNESHNSYTDTVTSDELDTDIENADELEIVQEKFLSRLTLDDVIIYWNPPKLHTISKQVIRIPDKAVQELIISLKLPWKRGRFNNEEDSIIQKSWKKLCSKYNLPDEPQIFAQWRNKKHNNRFDIARKFVIMWLSKKLPNRTPAQVYQRFIHTLGLKNKGRFTEDQKSAVEEYLCCNKNGITQQFLGASLGRDERSIWRCIQLLEKNGSASKRPIKWNLRLSEKVVNSLISVVKESKNSKGKVTLETLRYYKITWEDWKKVGEKVNLPPVNVKVYWFRKLYAMLFSPKPIYYRTVILKLIYIFKKKGYRHWADIDWSEVASYFKFIPTLFLYKRFYYVASVYCRDFFTDFNKVVIYLYHGFIINKDLTVRNFKLQRIAMDESNKLYITSDPVE